MPAERPRSHLATETILDLLENRLSGRRLAEAEQHLGLPCPACREKLRAMGALLGRLAAGDLEEVPEGLRRAAIDLFPAAPPAAAAAAARAPWKLVFDSSERTLAPAMLRTVGEARRLRFEGPGGALELEAETESADTCVLRGRLEAAEPELCRVVAVVGAERAERWVDAGGHFVLEGVPRGETRVTVIGAGAPFETPPFET